MTQKTALLIPQPCDAVISLLVDNIDAPKSDPGTFENKAGGLT